MKINTADALIETSGIGKTTAFGIKTSAAAFQLLSSGLYTNKVQAVLREIGCNAVDAHKLNDNTDKPIEVKLPNKLDHQFYIRDFGPGLSHEHVLSLYSTYFDSTKQASDEFIGGFGVGSKSPFAYTDTFTVVSRHKGVLTTYAAYVNDEGVPTISAMGDATQTNEPDGLSVGFPVKPEDFIEFEKEAANVFSAFTVTPTILGSSVNIEEYKGRPILDNVAALPHTKRGFRECSCINMGGVRYPLTELDNKLRDNGLELTNLGSIALKEGLEIHVPIGKVSVAASREALQYDKKTLNSLAKILNDTGVSLFQFVHDKTKESIALHDHPIDRALHARSALNLFRGWQYVRDRDFETLFSGDEQAIKVFTHAKENCYHLNIQDYKHIDFSVVGMCSKSDVLDKFWNININDAVERRRLLYSLKRRNFICDTDKIKLPLDKNKTFSALLVEQPLSDLTILSIGQHIIENLKIQERIVLFPKVEELKKNPSDKDIEKYKTDMEGFRRDVERLSSFFNTQLTYVTILDSMQAPKGSRPKPDKAIWGIPIHEYIPTRALKRTLKSHASSEVSVLLDKQDDATVGYVVYDRKLSQTKHFDGSDIAEKFQDASFWSYKHKSHMMGMNAPGKVYMIDIKDITTFKNLHPNAIDYIKYIKNAPDNPVINNSFNDWLSQRRPAFYLNAATRNWISLAEAYNAKYGDLPKETPLSDIYKKWTRLLNTSISSSKNDIEMREFYHRLLKVPIAALPDIDTNRDIKILSEHYPYIRYFNYDTPKEIKIQHIHEVSKKDVSQAQHYSESIVPGL